MTFANFMQDISHNAPWQTVSGEDSIFSAYSAHISSLLPWTKFEVTDGSIPLCLVARHIKETSWNLVKMQRLVRESDQIRSEQRWRCLIATILCFIYSMKAQCELTDSSVFICFVRNQTWKTSSNQSSVAEAAALKNFRIVQHWVFWLTCSLTQIYLFLLSFKPNLIITFLNQNNFSSYMLKGLQPPLAIILLFISLPIIFTTMHLVWNILRELWKKTSSKFPSHILKLFFFFNQQPIIQRVFIYTHDKEKQQT